MSLPPKEIPLGAIRFNSDSQKLEYWMGSAWMQILTFTPSLDGGSRGLFGGGQSPAVVNNVDYVTIPIQGNAIDFGNLTRQSSLLGACSSRTRGLWGGDYPSAGNVIDFVTISTLGDATDFGDLTDQRYNLTGFGNETRGCFAGGHDPSHLNVIDFVTISSTGNANDFGDMVHRGHGPAGAASPVRGFVLGGYSDQASAVQNTIQFVTIATTGNAVDFGDLVNTRRNFEATSNTTRCCTTGGYSSPTYFKDIQLVTMSSLGNAVLFGELIANIYVHGTSGDQIRGLSAGGQNPGNQTRIEYFNFATQGDSNDFGDLTVGRHTPKGVSNAHGGLG